MAITNARDASGAGCHFQSHRRRDSVDTVGDAQFRVMCNMWGVDAALKALKRMGMSATDKQIESARRNEMEVQKRWNSVWQKEQEANTDA